MKLEEYKNILITGTPSDRARAIAEAGNDRSLTDEEFHELTAMIKGFAVRALPGDLQEDAINVLSRTVSGMLGDLTAMMAETGEP